ncbi:MAG: peptide chain release factor 2 [Micrococcales bacterium]|nr:peptide chain release factor 2 [Micrococcales bacterium]NBR60616.1 peptide chain release factor 2 [Actinomycetota bacterium]NBT46875.1 peptide chain release factor 2 [Actinomycetota bacterium]NBY43938.1 peptide chain release factor 2 [Micrococcales bacterium]NDE89097.1 peptide chain release factor 2 [Micrococcales bacterium]
MSELDLSNQIKQLRLTLGTITEVNNLPKLEQEILELEKLAQDPKLWDNPENAQKITSGLSRKQTLIKQMHSLKQRIDDLEVLVSLANSESDEAVTGEAKKELAQLEKEVSESEIQTLLNGEYDSRSAIMTIRSGAGGDDATDFAEMLLRMYLRYCEKQGWKTQVLDTSFAEGAGIKSATFEIDEPYAFGQLSVEAGTHRLVRMSPFNAAGKRQTSFAAVEVVPLIEQTDVIEIPEHEIRVDVFRSSGPGGQSVNTTDSAVRITHLPTGTVVSCQNEKSQLQNKAAALRVLQSRLLELRRTEEEAQKKQLAGDATASWGDQMRNYVLAPYQMVKDLRTNFEVNNPDAVFDGDLAGFIASGIRWRKTEK